MNVSHYPEMFHIPYPSVRTFLFLIQQLPVSTILTTAQPTSDTYLLSTVKNIFYWPNSFHLGVPYNNISDSSLHAESFISLFELTNNKIVRTNSYRLKARGKVEHTSPDVLDLD